MYGAWLAGFPRPAEAGGSNVSVAGPRARMRGGARPDNALFQGELVPGWPLNRRDTRDAAA